MKLSLGIGRRYADFLISLWRSDDGRFSDGGAFRHTECTLEDSRGVNGLTTGSGLFGCPAIPQRR